MHGLCVCCVLSKITRVRAPSVKKNKTTRDAAPPRPAVADAHGRHARGAVARGRDLRHLLTHCAAVALDDDPIVACNNQHAFHKGCLRATRRGGLTGALSAAPMLPQVLTHGAARAGHRCARGARGGAAEGQAHRRTRAAGSASARADAAEFQEMTEERRMHADAYGLGVGGELDSMRTWRSRPCTARATRPHARLDQPTIVHVLRERRHLRHAHGHDHRTRRRPQRQVVL